MGRKNKRSNQNNRTNSRNDKSYWRTGGNKTPVAVVVETEKGTLALKPCDKQRARFTYEISKNSRNRVKEGDVVTLEETPSNSGKQTFSVRKIIGHKDDPGIQTTISIFEHGLRHKFSGAVLNKAKNLSVPSAQSREDLRHIPLITIDPVDARDFDDAVFAEPTKDGGHHLIVAIADVAWYVRPDDALDKEAYERGNSTYFPDKVIPMLPEAISNDLCSLRPHEDRACMGFHMWIDKDGNMTGYKPFRGLMRSHARLTYEQAQAAQDGNPDATTKPLIKNIITPLYNAYEALKKARENRDALDFDRPEQKIIANDNGTIKSVAPYQRQDSNRLIEEFMILTNVAAAKALQDKGYPCVYRSHEPPKETRQEQLKDILDKAGIPANDLSTPADFKKVMEQAKNLPNYEDITIAALRAQAKARYRTDNAGHFGLALDEYAHFTSPIRRAADLFVHRLLVSAYNLGDGGITPEQQNNLSDIASHISSRETATGKAENDAKDRLSAAFLAAQTNKVFEGRIQTINKAGIFVRLNDTGARGLIPLSTLSQAYGEHLNLDKDDNMVVGSRSGQTFAIGDKLTVELLSADGLSGEVVFKPLQNNKKQAPRTGTSPAP